ncbi:toxin-antitoxin system HicB family antitoxin [Blastomonas sp.]|uniref:toxin-antitoxin system HicB family antitoxin n=1 Tax=Blastomonas sp. TaxID=1909299 RepID=UPI00406A7A5E
MPSPPPKKSFALRLDPSLHVAIERAAAQELRSVNAEIEILLREALSRRGIRLAPPEQRPRGRPPKE